MFAVTALKAVVLDTRRADAVNELLCNRTHVDRTRKRRGQSGLTVQSNTMRTGAIALTALILTITVMIAPKSMPQKVAADTYGADYLVLNPEMD
jgi:hypothetical protein